MTLMMIMMIGEYAKMFLFLSVLQLNGSQILDFLVV